MIGFVPVCSFFFLREAREREHEVGQSWEEERSESKGEKLNLIDTHFRLWLTLSHNLKSGVLNYTRSYIVISITLLLLLIVSYVFAIGLELPLVVFVMMNITFFLVLS